ncbi:MAG TPA: hypothetical protein VGG00_07145 [Rhodanobacter sp.]|jgi:hypothetical protein
MKIRRKRPLGLNDPLRHQNHRPPVTRRQFLAQGFTGATATVAGFSLFSMFADPRRAYATLAPDIAALKISPCDITTGSGMIPFICFDLAGGGNIAGSNVLVGGPGGQHDFLTTAGYNRLGLPGNMIPNASAGTGNFIDQSLGVAFHSDSAYLRGIKQRIAVGTAASVNGAILPAMSENDTGDNPHNPMYGIYSSGYAVLNPAAGNKGDLLALIGTESSTSGGNSMAPSYMIDPTVPPTKVAQASDVTGLVSTGQLVGLLSQNDATLVLESIERISANKLNVVNTQLGATQDAVVKDLVQCGYVGAADQVDRYGNASTTLNPDLDTDIVGASGIFTTAEYNADSNFQATAAVMKMVVNGYASAGTIELGGYDYHTNDRATGEMRDLEAGQCIGACLEYAARMHQPLMIYVFTDGSVVSSGMVDNSVGGRGKGVWTADNQSTAATFFLVYNPNGRPTAISNQIGSYTKDGNVNTTSSPGANAVNLLAETVVLNYLALHNKAGAFQTLKWASGLGTGLGGASAYDALIALAPIR